MNFKELQLDFLKKIKGSKNKYKRVALSPIRYAGGKSLAVGYIVENLPSIKRLISPFFGGGSFEVAIAQKLGVEVIGCDINKDLTNYWFYQTEDPIKLYNGLKKLKPTKEEYLRVKQICKDYREGKIKLSNLKRAIYFYFNHNLSYGPSYIGWASSVYINNDKYQKMIEKVRDFKGNIKIINASFEDMFEKYPNDFFYCDPPYFLKEEDKTSKMFKGIYPERNKPIYHNNFNHDLLKSLLHKHQGGFILSYNDCKKSRIYYKDFKIECPKWQYTMGQGETRISKVLGNRRINENKAHIKKSHELLILGV